LRRPRLSPEALAAAAIAALFIALSAWWLFYDNRIPGGGDPGRHLYTALVAGEMLGTGSLAADPRASISDAGLADLVHLGGGGGFFYPPVVHIIGGVFAALDLAVHDWGTFALNLIFVPMLAAGCFGVGRLVYGPTAGLLAVAFALGTPMVLSLFHAFLLDAPLAGSVAVTVWALLASERFARRRPSVIAGALLGFAMLVKTVAPLFVIGPVVAMLAAGGWRRWQNVLLFGLAALIVAGPYYALHLDDVSSLSGQATSAGQLQDPGLAYDPGAAYSRFSWDNFAYYGWVAANLQYFVPLLLLFVAGVAYGIRELRRGRRGLLELFAGVAGGYLAVTFLLSIRDPRYSLPLIVFVAVLATGWITVTRRPALQMGGVAVLCVAVTLNVATSITDRLPTLKWFLPASEARTDPVDPGTLTFLDDYGWLVGPPHPDNLWNRLLDAAGDRGVKTARLTVRKPAYWGTEPLGFEVFARGYGIGEDRYDLRRRQPELVINTWLLADELWARDRGLPRPCGGIEEGAMLPESSDPAIVRVAVELRDAGGTLRRWCRF
jgi:hypothetical protein